MNHFTHWRNASRRICLCALAFGLLSLKGNTAPIGISYLLRLRFKPGEVLTYKDTVSISVSLLNSNHIPGAPAAPASQPFSQTQNLVQRMRVLKIAANGNAVLEVQTNSEQGGSRTQTTTVTYDSRGNPVGTEKSAQGASGAGMLGRQLGAQALGLQGIYLPTKPVRPGDTWTQRVPVGASTGTVRGAFVSLGRVGRYKTAHLRTVVTIPINTSAVAPGTAAPIPGMESATISGMLTMTYENDFAVTEGRLVRSGANGSSKIAFKSKGNGAKAGMPPGFPAGMGMNVSTKIATTSVLVP